MSATRGRNSDASTRPVVAGPGGGPALDRVLRGLGLPTPDRSNGGLPRRGERYIVIGELGRGGMGTVHRAYDPKLQREVALKELHGGLFGAAEVARMVAEARAMAKLSHPNVVEVYDVEAGDDGRLRIVMEYVPGQTLRAWLRSEPRPWREVVAVFVAAGRGLSAAHCAGVIHRDFKPGNVLMGGSQGVKVADFGLAKRDSSATTAADSGLGGGDGGTNTQTGVVLGTPLYMAPEQHAGEPLDPSADQYSFCVALWAALAGSPPFSGEGLARAKQDGPPVWRPRPGRSAPRPVIDALRRGLSVQPCDRWSDLDAVLAVLEGSLTTARAWVWPGLAAGVTVGAAAWVLGAASETPAQPCSGGPEQLAGVWNDGTRASVTAALKQVGGEEPAMGAVAVTQQIDIYAERWTTTYTEACRATNVAGVATSSDLDRVMVCLHRARRSLRATAGVLADADTDVVANTDRLLGGLPDPRPCADADGSYAENFPPDPRQAALVEELRELVADSAAERMAGRFVSAQERLAEVETRVHEVEYAPLRSEFLVAKGSLLDDMGSYEAAELPLRQALPLAISHGQWLLAQEAASTLLGLLGERQGRPRVGLAYRSIAKGLARDPERVAGTSLNAASVLFALGELDQAESEILSALESFREQLGDDDPNVALAHNNLAKVSYAQGKPDQAERHLRAAIDNWERTLGPEHPDVALGRNNLASVLSRQGRHQEALAEFRRTLALYEALVETGHPDLAMAHHNLGDTLENLEEFAEAQSQYERARSGYVDAFGSEHPFVAQSHSDIGRVLHLQGRYEQAVTEHDKALALRIDLLGLGHEDTVASRNNIARSRLDGGEPLEALKAAREAWIYATRTTPAIASETALLVARALGRPGASRAARREASRFGQEALHYLLRAEEPNEAAIAEVREWLEANPPS